MIRERKQIEQSPRRFAMVKLRVGWFFRCAAAAVLAARYYLSAVQVRVRSSPRVLKLHRG
jgi:hypothetical protein